MEQIDTELHDAVRFSDIELVESALNVGLNPNAIGLYQWSPMHEASSNGDLDILILLLKYKGDPNCKDNLHGCTATHYAAKEDHSDCLQLLLDNGGRFDIANNEGQTPMDMAEGKCKEILEIRCAGDYITQTLRNSRPSFDHHGNINHHHDNTKGPHENQSQNEKRDTSSEIINVVTTHTLNDSAPYSSQQRVGSLSSCSDTSGGFDSADIGVRRNPPRECTPVAWDHIEVESRDTMEVGTGLLQLSFEYNSRTSILKIRIWQVEDLLLPPVEFANIGRIYVKSRVLPDKKGESKRKTEEHRLEDIDKMKTNLVTLKRKTDRDSFKAIFLPCSFKFTKALEYKKITKEMVSSCTVHIDVCAKQKYSTKSFPIANIQLPLKTAVRKLRKQRLQLHPCINYTMPDNVHAYDPKDLVIVSEGMYSNTIVSQPNLRALSDLHEDKQRRTNSAFNLKAMRTQSVESIPSVVVNVSDGVDDTDDILREIAVMDDTKRRAGLSSSEPEMTAVHMGVAGLPGLADMGVAGLPGSTDDELEEVKVMKPRRKISGSTPDMTVINVGESVETSFINSKFTKLKLNKKRVSSPLTSKEQCPNNDEATPTAARNIGSNFKLPSSRQAADMLQQVTIETPSKRTIHRKSKEQIAVIELDNQISVAPKPRPRLHRPTSPQNKLVIPDIKVIDADNTDAQTTIVNLDVTPERTHMYHKRKTPDGPKPGRVVDLRRQNEGSKDEVKSKKSISSHIEELSIERKSSATQGDNSAGYAEVTELSPRSSSSKRTSPQLQRKDVTDGIKVESDPLGTSNKSHHRRPKTDIHPTKLHHPRQEAEILPGESQAQTKHKTSRSKPERMKSPHSLTKETTALIRQQHFPQTLTHSMMQSEMNPQLNSAGKNHKISSSPASTDQATRMHYVSETQQGSPKDQKRKSPGRRPKEPSHKSDTEIEMATLIIDPAQLATPEFKLKAFQRTRNDPHPSTPYLHNRNKASSDIDESRLEHMDPFFVPASPSQSLSPRERSKVNSPENISQSGPLSQSPLSISESVSSQVLSARDSSKVNSGNISQSDMLKGDLSTEKRSRVNSPENFKQSSVNQMRTKGHSGSHGASRSSAKQGENNNGIDHIDRSEFKPIPNPVVTKIKQSWL